MSDSFASNSFRDISAELEIIESSLNRSDSRQLELENRNRSNSLSNNNLTENSIMPSNVPAFDVKNLVILPNFDGNSNDLHDFLNIATTLFTYYYDNTNHTCIQNILLFRGILSKLTGRAKEVVSIYGCENWQDVKTVLIQNFGDQRDENSLTRDLVNLKQNNETPLQFYEKCMSILNALCNYIDLHNDNVVIKNSKKDFFRKQTLTTFLAGLKEPLGSTIRAMRPTNLAVAMQFIQEENNIRYLQRNQPPTNFQHSKKHTTPLQPPRPVWNQQYSAMAQQFPPSWPQYRPAWQPQFSQQRPFPTGPIAINPRPSTTQRFPTNSEVFGKPQNVWSPKPGMPKQMAPPTPMSVNTRNSGSNYFKPHPNSKPTFHFEELFNIEQTNPYGEGTSSQYPDYAYYPEQDHQYNTENLPHYEQSFQEALEQTEGEADTNFPMDKQSTEET